MVDVEDEAVEPELVVVFLTPASETLVCAATTNQLVLSASRRLGLPQGYVELVGLSAINDFQCQEGLLLLEETEDFHPSRIDLLILWGPTAEALGLGEEMLSEYGGVGRITLGGSKVTVTTVRFPSPESPWWNDSLHQEFAVASVSDLLSSREFGRMHAEANVIISRSYAWN